MIDESRMLLDDCSQLSLGQNLAKVDGHFPCESGKRAFPYLISAHHPRNRSVADESPPSGEISEQLIGEAGQPREKPG